MLHGADKPLANAPVDLVVHRVSIGAEGCSISALACKYDYASISYPDIGVRSAAYTSRAVSKVGHHCSTLDISSDKLQYL